MQDEFLFEINVWIIGAVVFAAGIGISEASLRFGRRWRSELDEVTRTNLTTIEAAMLALIGLLLAFSLNMAVTRFDQRRELLVGEVNAIGTAWLRSGLCPEPTRTRLRSELRTYAQSRAELFGGANYGRIPEASKGQSLRDDIWRDASLVALSDPHSIQTGLLIQSVNDLIDLHTRRDVANNSHVPELVWWLLMAITLTAMGAVGFNEGQGSRSNIWTRVALTLALASTLSLTMDLDRPRRGLIKVSQAPMQALYESLGRSP